MYMGAATVDWHTLGSQKEAWHSRWTLMTDFKFEMFSDLTRIWTVLNSLTKIKKGWKQEWKFELLWQVSHYENWLDWPCPSLCLQLNLKMPSFVSFYFPLTSLQHGWPKRYNSYDILQIKKWLKCLEPNYHSSNFQIIYMSTSIWNYLTLDSDPSKKKKEREREREGERENRAYLSIKLLPVKYHSYMMGNTWKW